jgi:hypothetical protein
VTREGSATLRQRHFPVLKSDGWAPLDWAMEPQDDKTFFPALSCSLANARKLHENGAYLQVVTRLSLRFISIKII